MVPPMKKGSKPAPRLVVQLDVFGEPGRIVRPVKPTSPIRASNGKFRKAPKNLAPASVEAAKAGRDRALAKHLTPATAEKAYVVAELQKTARRIFDATRRPVSVNDVRHVLALTDYRGDPRVLSAAMPAASWRKVGTTTYAGGPGNAHGVGLFVPRDATDWSDV